MKFILSFLVLNIIISCCYAVTHLCLYTSTGCPASDPLRVSRSNGCTSHGVDLGGTKCSGGSFWVPSVLPNPMIIYSDSSCNHDGFCSNANCHAQVFANTCNNINLHDRVTGNTYLSYKFTSTACI